MRIIVQFHHPKSCSNTIIRRISDEGVDASPWHNRIVTGSSNSSFFPSIFFTNP
jgi:hypothetical protein